MAQRRDIRYLGRDFNDFKAQLVEFAKNYFPDTYNDFSDTSPGMMFIEMAAYVGDVLSFYQDNQIQETFLQYAKDPGNLYNLAYMMGYRPKLTTVSYADIEITQRIPSTGAPNYTPDLSYAATISPNAQLASGDQKFIIDQQVDLAFSSSFDPLEISIASFQGGNPAEFELKKTAKAFSGEIRTKVKAFGSAQKFETIIVEDTDIVGILDIRDSEGNYWYEVPFLGQDTIFQETANSGGDSNQVQFASTLQRVSRRFVTRFNSKGNLTIQFGSGIADDEDTTFLPSPRNVGSGTNQGIARLDYAYDPGNFLYSSAYGLAPSNTELTIRYLVGGGVQSNVSSNTINTQVQVTATANKTQYLSTLNFNNPKAATGGKDGDTLEEIRQNSLRAFSEQSRAVTLQDYVVRASSMPGKFGSIAKVHATKDQTFFRRELRDPALDVNPLAISLFVLAYNADRKLVQASSTLKDNLRRYLSQYIMITDSITIRDAFVINIGVKFDILALPNFSGREVLLECAKAIEDYFDVSKRSINESINISSLYTVLDRVVGVQTVRNITIENKTGGRYSNISYNIQESTRDNIIFPPLDPAIFEIKYPQTDIQGRISTP